MKNPRATRRLSAACLAGLLFFVAQAPSASLGPDAQRFGNLDARPISKFVYGLGPGSDIMEVFESLHDQGQTILLITHEPHIAAHASRQIHLLDGFVEQDIITEKTR